MTDITTLKQLRDETGNSIAKCREALDESKGSIDQARELLRERGSIAAQKKSGRALGSGVVQAYIHTTNQVGAMVEILCETDFVARNEEFITLAREIAIHCAAFHPEYGTRKSIPEDVLEKVTNELKEGVDTSKDISIQEKVLQGKLDAKLKEVVLLEQPFLKDDSRTVQNIIEEKVQKFGERIELGRFAVWNI